MVKFIATVIFVGIAVSIISIAWPRFTGRTRPLFLQYVQGVAGHTSFGQTVSNVLGVSDTSAPVGLASMSGEMQQWATHTVENALTSFIASRIVRQIIANYDQFPARQKQELKEAICKP